MPCTAYTVKDGDTFEPLGTRCTACGEPVSAHEAEDAEYVARCPACGDVIDYCQGHGDIGDPAGAAILAAHDDGDHRDCHEDGCDDAGTWSAPAYAWPGGYPLEYLAADGSIVCPACASRPVDLSQRVTGSGIHWEGPADICDDCGAAIESAYGDPDAPEDPAADAPADRCTYCLHGVPTGEAHGRPACDACLVCIPERSPGHAADTAEIVTDARARDRSGWSEASPASLAAAADLGRLLAE